jgi:Zn-dependent protease with chaperone function
MWEKRSKVMFGSSVLIAGVLLVQMGMYAMKVLAGWELHFNLVDVCSTLMRKYFIPEFAYVLDAFVFYTLFFLVFTLVRQIVLSTRTYRRLKNDRHEGHCITVNQAFCGSGKEEAILVIEHPAPVAFTMGLWKPRIILSTGLMKLLDHNELKAVIYHEMYHQKHRDPVKTFVLTLFAAVMWYLPILKWFRHQYNIVREVMADHYAVNRLGSGKDLGGALVKMLKYGRTASMPVAVSFSDTSINYRIRRLLDPDMDIPLRLPFTPTMISVQVLLLLCSLFLVELS